LFEKIQYHKEFLAGDFAVTAFDAGHLLGSCSFVVTNGKKRIVFSGDLGNSPQTLVKPTEFIDSGDIVIEETTYGDREHPKEDSLGMLQKEINLVEKSGGTLLVPAFSLNRTQDLLYKVKVLKREKKMKDSTPVFMDSPMAGSATIIHLKHKYLFNNNMLSEAKRSDPFEFPGLKIKRRKGKAKSLRSMGGTKVIIAGSGMMSGGRIVSHSKDFLPDKSTRLFIVGYQGEGTMGRQIEEGAKTVEIDGTVVEINATVTKAEGMSSHAGQGALLNWLNKVKGTRRLILTHGDNPSREAYERLVKQKTNITEVIRPNINEEHFI
jgi:metallo-beta-lactamase family protein